VGTAETIPNPAITPKPGKYEGILTIDKDLFAEGLHGRVTLRAVAKVDASYALTILAVVPESPVAAAANPESNVSRGVRQADGSYLIDGKYRLYINVLANGFQLGFANPEPPMLPPVKAPAVVGYNPPIVIDPNLPTPAPMTRIHYRFYPEKPQPTRRSR
jgi:hypothetical protein